MEKYYKQMEEEEESNEDNNIKTQKNSTVNTDYQFDGYIIELNTTVVLTPIINTKEYI